MPRGTPTVQSAVGKSRAHADLARLLTSLALLRLHSTAALISTALASPAVDSNAPASIDLDSTALSAVNSIFLSVLNSTFLSVLNSTFLSVLNATFLPALNSTALPALDPIVLDSATLTSVALASAALNRRRSPELSELGTTGPASSFPELPPVSISNDFSKYLS